MSDKASANGIRLQAVFETEQLRLVAEQIGRLPIVLLAINIFIAWLVVRSGRPGVGAAWFVIAAGFDLWRYRVCANERRNPSSPAGPRLRLLSRAFVAAALLRVVLVPLFFIPERVDLQVTYTMVCAGLAAGGVATAGGVTWAYAIWAALVGTTLAGFWMAQGGVDGFGVGLLVAMLFATLAHYAREQGRSLRKLLELAYENEALASSLRIERDRAEHASQSKTRFFASASHDLRQPLHALSINATALEILASRQSDPLVQKLSHSITRSLRQSNELLDVLLDISQLDAGVVEIEFERVEVKSLLQRLRDQFLPAAKEQNLSISLQLPDTPLPPIKSDPRQLRRILGNLISNSLKFTRQGGVVLEAAEIEDGHLALSVVDTGPGIPADEQARVFEDFYQLGNASRDRTRGLGLGLSIVRRTAELLDAKVTLVSSVGNGCRVTVSVPILAAESAARGPSTPAAVSDSQLNLRVLAIDDEQEILDSLATLLPLYGCKVACALDIDAAKRLLDAGFRPQILLVDHRLRQSHGTQVIAELRQRLGDLPAVIVTGDTAPSDLQNAIRHGTVVVHKPVDGELLAQALQRAMIS